jgi:hypothetical protein
MYITDTRPVSASGFVVPFDSTDPQITKHMRVADNAAVIMLTMDNGSVVKSLHGHLRGHGNFVRIHGNKGLMESGRAYGSGMRVVREPWDKRKGEPRETVYHPDFPEYHEQAMRAGHGGGDFFTNYHFANAIRTGEQPYLDVYRGLDMTIAGIQAWRSALDGGKPYEIPDLRDEKVRKKFENDHWSPNPEAPKKFRMPCSVLGKVTPSPEAEKLAAKVWKEQGYVES